MPRLHRKIAGVRVADVDVDDRRAGLGGEDREVLEPREHVGADENAMRPGHAAGLLGLQRDEVVQHLVGGNDVGHAGAAGIAGVGAQQAVGGGAAGGAVGTGLADPVGARDARTVDGEVVLRVERCRTQSV